jgi:hypothetical protein
MFSRMMDADLALARQEERIMERRELLGLLGAGTAGLFLTRGAEARGDEKAVVDMSEHIKTIGECARACNEAAHHCLGKLSESNNEHREHHARAHELALDCQAFCTLTASLAARSSPLATYAHQACAEACRCCADECEKGHGEVMKACAQKCRECERVCKAMGKAGESQIRASGRS